MAEKKKNFANKSKNKNKENRVNNVPVQTKKENNVFYYTEGMTVSEIAEGLGVGTADVIKKLMLMGVFANQTQSLDAETTEMIALEFDHDFQYESITDMTRFDEIEIIDNEEDLCERPCVVTIMGHVDHGKTTLLDTIRNSRVVSTEAGGITQHIGAYQVERNKKLITFIDTPGHAAFTEMRARGAKCTDIIILVVAADDGVMPQTREAIDHAKAANCPIIVAVNKVDKHHANPDRVKQELAELNLLVEDWGGDVPCVHISALKGQNVDVLLDTIQLVAEMEEYKANPNRLGIGVVIESKLDKGKGPLATLLVKNGTLKVGDSIVVGTTHGKVRAMNNDFGRQIPAALPSTPVEVVGLNDVPEAGDHFMVFPDERKARLIAEARAERKLREERGASKAMSLDELFSKTEEGGVKELRLILKGDTHGTIEALKGSLEKIDVENIAIDIIRGSVGTITETDVSLAQASNAIIIGFNVRPQSSVRDMAKEKGVEIRLYNIIYKALEDIEAAMKGMLDPVFEEQVIGQCEVRDTFKISKVGTIAGCFVTEGSIKRDSLVRVIRDGIIIYEGKMSSLKRFKDDVKEVRQGFDCGIMIDKFNDIKVGDIIEASVMEEVK